MAHNVFVATCSAIGPALDATFTVLRRRDGKLGAFRRTPRNGPHLHGVHALPSYLASLGWQFAKSVREVRAFLAFCSPLIDSLIFSGYKERQLDEWFRTRRQLSPPNRLAIRYVVLPGSGQEVQLRSTALREFASLRVTSDAEMFLRMLTDKLHGMVRGYMDRT